MTYPQLQDLRFRAYAMAAKARVSPLTRRYRIVRGVQKMIDGDITVPEFTALWPRLREIDSLITNQELSR